MPRTLVSDTSPLDWLALSERAGLPPGFEAYLHLLPALGIDRSVPVGEYPFDTRTLEQLNARVAFWNTHGIHLGQPAPARLTPIMYRDVAAELGLAYTPAFGNAAIRRAYGGWPRIWAPTPCGNASTCSNWSAYWVRRPTRIFSGRSRRELTVGTLTGCPPIGWSGEQQGTGWSWWRKAVPGPPTRLRRIMPGASTKARSKRRGSRWAVPPQWHRPCRPIRPWKFYRFPESSLSQPKTMRALLLASVFLGSCTAARVSPVGTAQAGALELTVEYTRYACEPLCANFHVTHCTGGGLRCGGLIGKDVCIQFQGKSLDESPGFDFHPNARFIVVRGARASRTIGDFLFFRPTCINAVSWKQTTAQ